MSSDRPALAAALAARYRIERELGRGGMATVYLAHDLKHDRPVALKVLRPEIAAALGGDRFLREIAITARLDHPHILTLIDSGDASGFLFYVVPYVRGESLRSRLDRDKQLPLEEALRITQQMASALDHAHRQGVIHRDIKPENILLHEGEAMVADFGIALAVQGGERLTETGLSVGTPEYMSPEQAAGDRQLDARSDVYSLGAVLYEMLAGEPPHTGPTALAVIAKILAAPPTRLQVVRGDVPAPLDHAVTRALAKLPAERFATAAAFAAALSETRAPPVMRYRGSGRRRAAAAGAVVLLALLVALWGWHQWRSGDRPLVIMMDSPHPDRVYDEETVRASGTNADVISDILADLPIVRQKELGGPGWHRYDEILAFHPDLVIMHYSTFRGSDSGDARPGLKTFLTYFADRPTLFLIYTRSHEAEVRRVVDSLMTDVEAQHPGLLARIRFFGTPDHGGGPHWRDPVTAGELKLAVKRILKLN
jgi:hypothetical protein